MTLPPEPMWRVLERFKADIPRHEALRYLGMTRSKGTRRPRAGVMQVFDEEYAVAQDLVQPRAVLAMSNHGLAGSAFVAPGSLLGLGIGTIGPELEHRVAQLSASGETLRAVILDAIGSAAAESVAEQSNRLLRQHAASRGLTAERRRSPGYGSWPLQEQKLIFALLQPDDAGVSLNDASMMVPRKSVSYVATLRRGPALDQETRHGGSHCDLCDLTDCRHRESS